jgi:hypothetical protein
VTNQGEPQSYARAVTTYAEFSCRYCDFQWADELPPLDEPDWPTCPNPDCHGEAPGKLMYVLVVATTT